MAVSLFADHYNVCAVNTMMRLARICVEAGRSPAQWYRAAGQHLARLRQGRTKAKWGKIVADECGLCLSRTYELVALGNGKPLEDLRAGNSSRAKKKRARKVLASNSP